MINIFIQLCLVNVVLGFPKITPEMCRQIEKLPNIANSRQIRKHCRQLLIPSIPKKMSSLSTRVTYTESTSMPLKKTENTYEWMSTSVRSTTIRFMKVTSKPTSSTSEVSTSTVDTTGLTSKLSWTTLTSTQSPLATDENQQPKVTISLRASMKPAGVTSSTLSVWRQTLKYRIQKIWS